MDRKAYRRLTAWQLAMDLAAQVYEMAAKLPAEEKFGLRSQVQRSATSISANIAEGYGRSHRGDYLRHLSIARGSLMELETHMMLLVRLKLLPRDQVIPVWQTAQSTGKTLTALIRSLQDRPNVAVKPAMP